MAHTKPRKSAGYGIKPAKGSPQTIVQEDPINTASAQELGKNKLQDVGKENRDELRNTWQSSTHCAVAPMMHHRFARAVLFDALL